MDSDAAPRGGRALAGRATIREVKRLHYLLLGGGAYLLAVAPMVYFVGFLAGRWVPKGIDDGPATGLAGAVAMDLALLTSFALLHSLLVRPKVKQALLGWVPAPLERAAYSAVAGVHMIVLMAFWRPLPTLVWRIDGALARGLVWSLFALGWAVVVASLPAIGHTHLFGLRQAWAGSWRQVYVEPPLLPRGPYRWVRHPLYVGTILGMSAVPRMSVGHALLAGTFTAYILVGARLEDRGLALRHGEAFLAYRKSVPAYLPRFSRRDRPA